MNKYSILIALLCLCACQARPGPVHTQKVNIPVTVSCKLEKIDKPVWQVSQLPAGADYGQRVNAALIDLAAAHAYIGQVNAQLEACE